VLETALATVLRQPSIGLTVAGRTDAGVHATGQVASADIPSAAWDRERGRLVRQLTGVLPPDVRVRAVRAAPAAFDARFAALWRHYEYRLCDSEFGADPLRRRFVLSCSRSLDVEAMTNAAATLVGLHDFAAFCRRRPGATTIRRLERLAVERAGPEIVCSVVADAFCHSMVRSIVGALIAVGEGRRPTNWPSSLLSRQERANEVTVAPPHGLTLVEVGYPPDDQLAARLAETRARRG
jgi:tRNA pseudouridine38-40 synthase